MFAVVRAPIDPRALEGVVVTEACGAVVTFCGIVRERAQDGAVVTGLTYEAYDAMAEREFAAIAHEARARFGQVRVAIVHRIGQLVVGEIAVCVAVASAHRAAAFNACAFAIDTLKARAPVWKKEHYAQGEPVWISNEC